MDNRALAFKNGRVKGLLEKFKHEGERPLAPYRDDPDGLETMLLELEKRFEKVRKLWDDGETDDFSLDDWRTLLAYEMWKDGMEWPDVLDLWNGKDEQYNDRGSILVCLGQTFGYIKEDA